MFLLFQYRRGFELSRLLLFVDVASVFECSVYVRHFPFNFLLKSYATHSHSLHLQELQTCTFTINTILFCVGYFCLHVRNYIYIYNLKKTLVFQAHDNTSLLPTLYTADGISKTRNRTLKDFLWSHQQFSFSYKLRATNCVLKPF